MLFLYLLLYLLLVLWEFTCEFYISSLAEMKNYAKNYSSWGVHIYIRCVGESMPKEF